jgi:hypothetical protein
VRIEPLPDGDFLTSARGQRLAAEHRQSEKDGKASGGDHDQHIEHWGIEVPESATPRSERDEEGEQEREGDHGREGMIYRI